MATIITNEMTLDEKLAAIDAAMKPQAIYVNKNMEVVFVTPDPADLTMCMGCQ